MVRRRCLAALLLVAAAVSAQDPAPDPPAANARVARLLTRLRAQPALRCTARVTNFAYQAALAQRALRLGRARPRPRRFQVHAVREGGLACWWIEEVGAPAGPKDAGPKDAGPHVLARSAAGWIVQAPAAGWQRCQRPSGVWAALFLPDPLFLAAALLDVLPRSKWEVGAENIDERLVRVYRVELGDEAVSALIRSGAIATTSDYGSGLGLVGRDFLGRTVRPAKRTLRVRLYVDPKAKLPVKFVTDLYQEGRRTVAAALSGGGTADADGKKTPFLRTEIVLADLGTAKATRLGEAARKLLR